MKTDNPVVDKSKAFALKVIKLYQYLCSEKHEFVLSKQLLRSGTSIAANIKEGIRGQSKADFHARFAIALREASESELWLELLHESDYISAEYFNGLYADCQELLRLLMAITKTAKANQNNTKR